MCPRSLSRVLAGSALSVGVIVLATSPASATPPSSLTSPECPTVIVKSQYGSCVERLQSLLDTKAGEHLVVDGRFGSYTLAAVVRWQRSHSLLVDGEVGPKTKASLEGTNPPAPPPPTNPPLVPGKPYASTAFDQKVVAKVDKVMSGTLYPYVWGGGHGSTPGPGAEGGMDCSGFSRWVYALAAGSDVLGQSTAQDQRVNTLPTSTPHPGDLVFFTYTATNYTYHVAIYLGGGRTAHESGLGTVMRYGTVAGSTATGAVATYGHVAR
jgi:peptidoglycan hydrolase-like protein with peptidoglycan-binding domain